MNEIGNLTEAMTADVPRQRHRCPDCTTEYTSEVNLRAHQYRMHQKANLELATTRELLNELRMRAEEWAHVPKSGSGWLADQVDDAYFSLEGLEIMKARRGGAPVAD